MGVDLFMTLFLTAMLAATAGLALDDSYGTGVSWAEVVAAVGCGAAIAVLWIVQIARVLA